MSNAEMGVWGRWVLGLDLGDSSEWVSGSLSRTQESPCPFQDEPAKFMDLWPQLAYPHHFLRSS